MGSARARVVCDLSVCSGRRPGRPCRLHRQLPARGVATATPRHANRDHCRHLRRRGRHSGVSAALEAARLGRRVVIVDAAPALGGQAVGSIIGTIIGLYTHGPKPYQITHGIADDLIADLTPKARCTAASSMTGTITFLYDEVRLGRWIERKVEEAGVRAIVGAVLTDVAFEGRRAPAHRAGDAVRSVRVAAQGLRRRVRRRHPQLRGRPRGARARCTGLRLAQLRHRGLRHRRGQEHGHRRRARAAGGARAAPTAWCATTAS